MYTCMCNGATLLYSRKLAEHCKPAVMEKNTTIKKICDDQRKNAYTGVNIIHDYLSTLNDNAYTGVNMIDDYLSTVNEHEFLSASLLDYLRFRLLSLRP